MPKVVALNEAADGRESKTDQFRRVIADLTEIMYMKRCRTREETVESAKQNLTVLCNRYVLSLKQLARSKFCTGMVHET